MTSQDKETKRKTSVMAPPASYCLQSELMASPDIKAACECAHAWVGGLSLVGRQHTAPAELASPRNCARKICSCETQNVNQRAASSSDVSPENIQWCGVNKRPPPTHETC
eukprot:1315332-Rhodomonas_salina.2